MSHERMLKLLPSSAILMLKVLLFIVITHILPGVFVFQIQSQHIVYVSCISNLHNSSWFTFFFSVLKSFSVSFQSCQSVILYQVYFKWGYHYTFLSVCLITKVLHHVHLETSFCTNLWDCTTYSIFIFHSDVVSYIDFGNTLTHLIFTNLEDKHTIVPRFPSSLPT